MHLSIHSDCFLSDTLQDSGIHQQDRCQPQRASLLRGLAAIGIAGLLVGLTCLANLSQPAAADTARHEAVISSGSAVNVMHREVTRH